MGREKIKIYEYTKEGNYIRMYSDMSECRKLCFSEIKGKVPILRFKNLGIKYGFTKDDNFLFKQRVNRDDVVFLNRVIESEYCSNIITKDQKIVQVYNLERILLLEARNINVLSKITNINKSTIYRQLNYKPEEKQTRIYPSGLIFKYKEEKNVLNYE